MDVDFTWELEFNNTYQRPTFTLPTPLINVTSADGSDGMPLWAHRSWTGVFAAMLFVAIGGNAIVIWIVTAHRRMRTVTNYFLVNLSLADLLMASLNCLFNSIYMIQSDWIFGVKYCQLSNFIANVTVAASVFTLTGISFDRYQAILLPMKPRMSKTYSLVMIAGIWASGMILAIPCLLYSTTKEYRSKGTTKTACLLVWPDGLPDVSYMDFLYQTLYFVVTYAIPMSGMIFFYSAMARVLWGSGSIGEMTQRQIDSIKSKRKVVKMFIFVIIIFGICWLPYNLYFISIHFYPSLLYKKYIQHVYLGFYWLAMANAMVNPIIYYWMNANHQKSTAGHGPLHGPFNCDQLYPAFIQQPPATFCISFRTYFRTAMLFGWRKALGRLRKRRPPESPPDYGSQSGSRSRSGFGYTGSEEPKDSRGEWPRRGHGMRHLSVTATQPPQTLRHPLHARCPRCPRDFYDVNRILMFLKSHVSKESTENGQVAVKINAQGAKII